MVFIDKNLPNSIEKRKQFLPSSKFLSRIHLGHSHTISDLYFLNAIQYFGETKNKEEEFRWLYPMLEIVTELDPLYGTPYRWGGVVLPFFNGVSWTNINESNMLLLKGLEKASKTDERYWQIPFYLGWNAMAYEKNNKKAGDFFIIASKLVRGAAYPRYLSLLATKLYASANDPEMGLKLAEESYKSETDPDIKKELEKRIKELKVESDLKLINRAIDLYKDKFKQNPASLEDLLQKGLIQSIPKEPFGGRYIIDKSGIAVSSTYRGNLKIKEIPFDKLKKQ